MVDIGRLKALTTWNYDYNNSVDSKSAKSDHSSYSEDTRNINKVRVARKEFWEDFENVFTEDDRQSFLRFVTGKRRMNKGEFNFKVSCMTSESSESLPKSHTCYNTIDVPLSYDR